MLLYQYNIVIYRYIPPVLFKFSYVLIDINAFCLIVVTTVVKLIEA